MAQTTQSLYSAFLTKKLDPADTTAEVSVAPTITSGRIRVGTWSNKELIKFTWVSGNTLTGLVRNLSKTGVPVTGWTGLAHIAGTKLANVIMHDQLVDKQEDQTFTWSITATDVRFSGTTTSWLRLKSVTTTQRLALTPANGDMVYDSTLSEIYQYIGWAWSAVSAGSTQPNASLTVAGKVELSTDAQITAGTATWETWASLVATPEQIKKSISLKNTTTTTSDTDLFIVSQSWEDKSITQTLLRDQLAASTTKKGTVEMATDAEVIAGTDESRYVNSKQLNYWNRIKLLSQYFVFDDSSGTLTVAHGCGKKPKLITFAYPNGDITNSINYGTWASDITTDYQKCYEVWGFWWSWWMWNGFLSYTNSSDTNDHCLWTITSVDATNINLSRSFIGSFSPVTVNAILQIHF